MKLAYAVVFLQGRNNYGAYVPDVPGCVSTGKTWDEVQAMVREALTSHIEFMLEDGDPVPEPKMSPEEAMAYHLEPISEDVMETYREFGDAEPALSTTFQVVEIEVAVPQVAQAS